jgi:hypothetical protein
MTYKSPRSTVVVVKLTVAQVVKIFPVFHLVRRFITVFTRVRHGFLFSVKRIQHTPSRPCFLKAHFNITPYPRLGHVVLLPQVSQPSLV